MAGADRIEILKSEFYSVLNIDEYRTLSTCWRRCIECLKLQVSFRKRATNYRALFCKITCKDKASPASSPPCSGLTFFLVFSRMSSWPQFLSRSGWRIERACVRVCVCDSQKSACFSIYCVDSLWSWLLRMFASGLFNASILRLVRMARYSSYYWILLHTICYWILLQFLCCVK